jgi:hypothetical protein
MERHVLGYKHKPACIDAELPGIGLDLALRPNDAAVYRLEAKA